MTGFEGRTVELAYDGETGVSDKLLWSRLGKAGTREDFAEAWLQLQMRALGRATTGVLILGEPEAGPFMPVAVAPPRRPVSADLSIAAETALAERRGVVRDQPPGERREASQCLAFPILLDEELHGVAAFQIEPRGADALAEAGRRLQWGVAWVEALVRRRTLLPSRQLVDVLDIVAAVLEAPGLAVALQTLAAETARSAGAEWVACGRVRHGGTVHVEALSQSITTARRQQVVTLLGGAMQECLDARSAVAFPEEADAAPVVTRAHRALGEAVGAGAVVSVPVVHGAEIGAVLTLVARPGHAFTPRDREFCRLLATVAGPAIELRARDDRWIGAKVAASILELLRRLVGPRHVLLKLGAAAAVAVAAILSVGTATYRVTAAATVEGAVQRAVAVPIAGYIAQQGPRAGDRIAEGEVMARLDDREFQIERARWVSERGQHLRVYQQALAQGDRSKLQVLKAEIEQSQSRIDLLDDQIARVELRAPIGGLIVKGDLSQKLGAPVGRGDVLFEIAPLDDYRIVLKVDERDANEVREGQGGDLILSSLPAESFPLRVTKFTPVSVAEDGRNTFRVEAALDRGGPAIRPGMQGYAKIVVGERPLLFIAGARLVQWLRMTAWRFWF